MDEKKKEILFELVFQKLLNLIILPRGYSKSPIFMYIQCREEAIRRTNYILDPIGEKLDSRKLQALL